MGRNRRLPSFVGAIIWLTVLAMVAPTWAAARAPGPLPGSTTLIVTVGDADPFTDREDGLVRVSGRTLAMATNAAARSISFADLALMTGTGDTVSTKVDSLARAPGLTLVPVERVDRNLDGIVDDDDEILFWARGTSIWKQDPSTKAWIRSIHPYDKKRCFFLQVGSRTPSGDLGMPREGAVSRTHGRVSFLRWQGRPDKLLEKSLSSKDPDDRQTGTGWYWLRSETPQDVVLDELVTPRFSDLASDTAWVTVQQANSGYPPEKNVSDVDLRLGAKQGEPIASRGRHARFRLTDFKVEANSLRLAGLSQFHLAGVALETLHDPSSLDSAVFPAPASGRIAIPVKPGSTCWVLEGGVAVRRCAVVGGLLRDSVANPDTWYAVFPSHAASRAVEVAPWRIPEATHVVSLTENVGNLDVLVVVPDEMLPVAEEYALWREMSWQVRKMKVGILPTRWVWAGWSGGSMDPAALRNALRWAKEKWSVNHVVLLGAGHADPRGLWPKSPKCWIPQWEDGQVSTDDYFTWFSEARNEPGIALGRVPAHDIAQAGAWLEKVKRFEDPARASFGPWRNTVVLLADDQWQGIEYDDIRHSEQIQEISRQISVSRPWMRQIGLYENSYKSSVSGFKPDVRRDLVSALGGEVSAFVYMGHGSPGILTDEVVMDVPTFQRTVTNPERPWFALLGSCSVGRNDMAMDVGLLETFVTSASKGAYTGIAATRATSPTSNKTLFVSFWSNLLRRDTPKTIGEALQEAKRNSPDSRSWGYGNDSYYNLLGDPAVIPYPGGIQVALDSVPKLFQPLSHVAVGGSVSGEADIQLRLEHALPILHFGDSTPARNSDGTTEKDREGKTVYKKVFQDIRPSPAQFTGAVIPMGSKRFDASFLLPARLPIGDTAWAKVYAWDARTRFDGGAVSAPAKIDGMGKVIPDDRMGPKIRLRHCDSSWGGGIAFGTVAKLPLPVCLDAFLEDSSGVSSSLRPDEGVVFALPGIREAWHPTLTIGNSLKSVSARLEIDSALLPPGGKYPFRVTAGDLMGNISEADIVLEPLARGDYAVYDLYASPNPVRDDGGVTFGFKVASEPDSTGGLDTRIQASIRIHTVTGKLVRIVRTELTNSSRPRPRADWDLRDAFGQKVANGMYPYTATLRIPVPFGAGVRELKTRGMLVISR